VEPGGALQAIKIEPTTLPGVVTFAPEILEDERGFFYEGFSPCVLAAIGCTRPVVQENVSGSRHGVVRGLHYQLEPAAQGKLVRVARGEIYDVCVDLRRGSPTFGRWHGTTLSADNRKRLWVPTGLAHGFAVLSEFAEVVYSVTAPYDRALERTIAWDDPGLAIAWPIPPEQVVLSPRDAAAGPFAAAEVNFAF
jgi:dTDP-4-dehydrorhamnose 3,5-epimerase